MFRVYGVWLCRCGDVLEIFTQNSCFSCCVCQTVSLWTRSLQTHTEVRLDISLKSWHFLIVLVKYISVFLKSGGWSAQFFIISSRIPLHRLPRGFPDHLTQPVSIRCRNSVIFQEKEVNKTFLTWEIPACLKPFFSPQTTSLIRSKVSRKVQFLSITSTISFKFNHIAFFTTFHKIRFIIHTVSSVYL